MENQEFQIRKHRFAKRPNAKTTKTKPLCIRLDIDLQDYALSHKPFSKWVNELIRREMEKEEKV